MYLRIPLFYGLPTPTDVKRPKRCTHIRETPGQATLARGSLRRPKLIGPGLLLGQADGYIRVDEILAESDLLESRGEQPHQDEIAVAVVVDHDVDHLACRVCAAGPAAYGRVAPLAAAGAIDHERHAGEFAAQVQSLHQLRVDAVEHAAALAGLRLLGKVVSHLVTPLHFSHERKPPKPSRAPSTMNRYSASGRPGGVSPGRCIASAQQTN